MIALSRIDIQFLGSHLWLSILLCLVLLAATILYYRRTTPPLPTWLKGILIALRAIAFIALFLVLTQPILTIVNQYNKNKSLAVISDRSHSMELPLANGSDETRKEALDRLLAGPDIKDLLEKVDYAWYAVAESLDATKQGLNLAGNKTDFGKAIDQLEQTTALKPFDYWLLLSDGRVTTGENLSDAAAKSETKLFTIAVGDSNRVDDIALDDVLYNDVLYAGRQTELKVRISQQGNVSGDRAIMLKEGGRILTQSSLTPPGDGRTSEVAIPYTPSQPGKKILTMDIAGGDDANSNNNRHTFAVRVLKSKLSLLLYSSTVNQEYAFLNRYLKSRDDYAVTTVIDANGGNRLGERFPTTQEQLNAFDAVIMIDPDLNRIKSHYDRFLSYLNDRGGGLMILLGEQYAASISGNDRMESLSPLAVTGTDLLYGKYRLLPNPRMIFHPAVKLGESREEINSIWQTQPTFSAMAMVDSVRSSGVALAFVDDPQSRKERGGMALRRMGGGKIIALAVSPLWHWAFYPLGVGGDASVYREFISGTIRWLTIGDESDRVNFKPITEVFESGDDIKFAGIARDEGFRAIENASGDVVVVAQSGDSSTARILPDINKEAGYYAEFGSMPPGEYTYRADMVADNVRLGRFDGKFAIDAIDRETALTDVDWTGLSQAAAVSGGVFAPYTNIEPVIDAIDVSQTDVTDTNEVRLWDNVILLIIILVALSGEWFLRKNRQLL